MTIQRLMMSFFERLGTIPKTDIHIHLSGVLSESTYLPFFSKKGITPKVPVKTPINFEEFEEIISDFIIYFDNTNTYEKAVHELASTLAQENIKYAEYFVQPPLSKKTMKGDDVIDACLRGQKKAEEDYDIKLNLVLGIVQPYTSLTNADEIIDLAAHYRNYVGGITITGKSIPELSNFERYIIERASKKDLKIAVHAGELPGTERAVRELIELGVRRIEQPVYIGQDEIDLLKKSGVGIVVSPIVNRMLSGKDSELDKYLINQLLVTLGSDNRAIFGANLTDQYSYAYKRFSLTFDEIKTLNINGIEISFLEPNEKQLLRKKFEELLHSTDLDSDMEFKNANGQDKLKD